MFKYLIPFFLIIFSVFFISLPVSADIMGVNIVDNAIELGNDDPRRVTVQIINIVLGFLGLIAVIIVIYGGFVWMTSGGNQEDVGKAKKILISGLIGLVIILLSWGITSYVVRQMTNLDRDITVDN